MVAVRVVGTQALMCTGRGVGTARQLLYWNLEGGAVVPETSAQPAGGAEMRSEIFKTENEAVQGTSVNDTNEAASSSMHTTPQGPSRASTDDGPTSQINLCHQRVQAL